MENTVPLNYNFNVPQVSIHGVMRNLSLRVCVDHIFSWHEAYTAQIATRVTATQATCLDTI